jgi:hypothetical protein
MLGLMDSGSSAAEHRDELAAPQPIEMHSLPFARATR